MDNGLLDEALERYKCAIQSDVEMLEAYLGMAQLLSMLNRDQDALGCLNEAL